MHDVIKNQYYEWLSGIVCENRFAKGVSYQKLLTHLHNTKFKHLIPRDRNRAEDGIDLRYRFAMDQGYEDDYKIVLADLNGRCSVLEMLVALAIRCEETIMDDPRYGNRTGQWFWGMIVNLGLGGVTDDNYDMNYVNDVIIRFLNRDYEPDGKGGLFTVRNCNEDLRDIEIWSQLCWYLDSFL